MNLSKAITKSLVVTLIAKDSVCFSSTTSQKSKGDEF